MKLMIIKIKYEYALANTYISIVSNAHAAAEPHIETTPQPLLIG